MLKTIFNFQPMRNYYPHATCWQVAKWNLAIVAAFIVVGGASAKIYNKVNPLTVYAEKTVTVEVEKSAPVLERIAKCESGGMHRKDGQVVFKANTNGTVDIGRYQINSVWNKKATELGLNLTVESDNKKMAEWIFANRGTGDWSASANCWNK